MGEIYKRLVPVVYMVCLHRLFTHTSLTKQASIDPLPHQAVPPKSLHSTLASITYADVFFRLGGINGVARYTYSTVLCVRLLFDVASPAACGEAAGFLQRTPVD